MHSRAGFPKLWVATQKWVAKFCQVGRQSFLEIFIFSHLFVNWIKILFSSYHCSQSSPPSYQHAKLIKMLTSRGIVTPTLRELHASPRKCQNVPLNDGPSPYKLTSLLCFLTCYTVFISPTQTSSTIFISGWFFLLHDHLTKFWNRAFVFAAPGWTYQAAGLHSQICIIIAL